MVVWKDWKRSAVLKVKFSVQTIQRHGSMNTMLVCDMNGRVKPFLSLFTKVIIIIFGAMPCTRTQFVMNASGACVHASVCFSIASSRCIFECQCNYDARNGCPHSNRQTKLQHPRHQRLHRCFSSFLSQIGCNTFRITAVLAIEWFIHVMCIKSTLMLLCSFSSLV